MQWWLPLCSALLRGPDLAARLDSLEAQAEKGPAERALAAIPMPPALDDVVGHLEGLLHHTEELLRYDGSEDRYGMCQKLEAEAAALDALPHAHVEPHDWAIRQVEAEVAFLCTSWQPENREPETLKEHADALHEVLITYEDRLKCLPGSVPCGQGGVLHGNVPVCSCQCLPGWTGDACSVAQCPDGCVAGVCSSPGQCDCHDPVAVVGAACDVHLTFAWAAGDWGLCPGKGRHADTQREVGCVRSDGHPVSDSECENRVGQSPPRVQDCCDPYERDELPYQECGDVDDGCGGMVSFGNCSTLLGHNVDPSHPLYPVVAEMKRLLAETSAALHHGSEQRHAACQSLHAAYGQTDTAAHFEATPHSHADEWALGQMETELAWLCGKRTEPFSEGEVQQHLTGLQEVYDAYMLQIACQPGDLPCGEQGTVGGMKGACTCTCNDGWHGADCSSAACDVGGSWTASNDGATIGLTPDPANHCGGQEGSGAWTYTVNAAGTSVTLSDGTTGTIAGTTPGRTITWSNGITYTEQSSQDAGYYYYVDYPV